MKAAEPHGKHLLEATRLGNIERMRDLIANLTSPADLQFRNKFGNTPLMLACQRSNVRAVQLLVSAGAPLDDSDKFGSGTLHYACRAGSLPIVRVLMTAGADIHAMNKHGRTPLEMAEGHADMIAFLKNLAKAEDSTPSLEKEEKIMLTAP